MFMLYAVAAGLLLGLVLRGRLEGLAEMRLRWIGLALAALLAQVVLFSGPVSAWIGDAGAWVYVASSAVVLVVVLRNLRLAGLPIVAVGAISNLVAILANGGWMPASPEALSRLGLSIGSSYSNSREVGTPALGALTDVFALPAWAPFANVFSIGDVLIGVGVAVAIVTAMRRARPVGVGAGGGPSRLTETSRALTGDSPIPR
jgi:hypothetical protein